MRRFASLALALIGLSGQASGQSSGCDRIRAELATTPPGARNQQPGRQLQRSQAELDRLTAYARSIGCQNRRFLMFGQDPPAQCGSLEAQIGRLESTVAALQDEEARAGPGSRRAQLLAAYDSQCRLQPAAQHGLMEQLFGAPQPQPIQRDWDPVMDMPEPVEPPVEAPVEVDGFGIDFSGVYKTFCVRKCDGFYYPMATASRQASFSGQADLCHAACPGAEAELFVKRPDADMAQAVSLDGTSYASLPNAFRYRRTYDATCGCRNQGQSWSETLAEAEKMLAGRADDVTVTEEKAQELSRAPRVGVQTKPAQRAKAKIEADASGPAGDPASAPGAVKSATRDGSAPPGATIGVGQGKTRQVITSSGEKKTIRMVAPPLAPDPQ